MILRFSVGNAMKQSFAVVSFGLARPALLAAPCDRRREKCHKHLLRRLRRISSVCTHCVSLQPSNYLYTLTTPVWSSTTARGEAAQTALGGKLSFQNSVFFASVHLLWYFMPIKGGGISRSFNCQTAVEWKHTC